MENKYNEGDIVYVIHNRRHNLTKGSIVNVRDGVYDVNNDYMPLFDIPEADIFSSLHEAIHEYMKEKGGEEMSAAKPFKRASEAFVNCNILKATVSTTGYCGGDSGHGGRTIIEIEDEASTEWSLSKYISPSGHLKGFRLELGGDAELDTIIEALRWCADKLTEMASENGDA